MEGGGLGVTLQRSKPKLPKDARVSGWSSPRVDLWPARASSRRGLAWTKMPLSIRSRARLFVAV